VKLRLLSTWDTSSFLSVTWSGVGLSPLGTSGNNWTIVPARDDK
jgi:hypothetical protein